MTSEPSSPHPEEALAGNSQVVVKTRVHDLTSIHPSTLQAVVAVFPSHPLPSNQTVLEEWQNQYLMIEKTVGMAEEPLFGCSIGRFSGSIYSRAKGKGVHIDRITLIQAQYSGFFRA